MPKHRRTILREAEQKLLSVNREDFLDAMERWSPPVTALPIGRCKRDDVAPFPIGLATLIGTGCVATKRHTVFDSGTD